MDKNKLVYRTLLALLVVSLLSAALLFALGFLRAGGAVATVSIAFFPFLGHLRMREALAAVRRLPRSVASEPTPHFQEKLTAIELNTSEMIDEISKLNTKKETEIGNSDLVGLVSEIRRESRLARIAAAKINGAL
ncbi:hypothetical protein [Corynebacterium sp. 20_84]